jgi:hypothetical protein
MIASAVKTALHGAEVVVDGKVFGNLAMQYGSMALDGPRTDSNRFDSYLHYSQAQ